MLMIRNLLTSLVLYESLKTTKPKLKEIISKFDHLISIAKPNDNFAKIKAGKILLDPKAKKKLFDILVPRYKNRASGFINYAKISNRKGDNSAIYSLQLIDKKKIAGNNDSIKKNNEKPLKKNIKSETQEKSSNESK